MIMLAVVVGRFQVADLHEGHRQLLDTATSLAPHLLVVLASTGGAPCPRNPLSHEARATLFLETYPTAYIDGIRDNPSDEHWSRQLDTVIQARMKEVGCVSNNEVLLLSGEDGFLKHYQGRYSFRQIVLRNFEVSGTAAREKLYVDDSAFKDSLRREGAILAARDMRPTSFQAVDIAVFKNNYQYILMGQKPHDMGRWRLVGGMVDPEDQSLEKAALRELREEAGAIEVDTKLDYVGSVRIDDYRYRQSAHKLMTCVFATTFVFGPVKAGSDLSNARWLTIEEAMSSIIDDHRVSMTLLAEYARERHMMHRQVADLLKQGVQHALDSQSEQGEAGGEEASGSDL